MLVPKMRYLLVSKCILTLVFVTIFQTASFSQSNNHWTRSFNEESSLLSGAVVGGGAGPAAIYYNPSSISEISESKFSLHASLFSFHFHKIKNALGDGEDLSSILGVVEPRFLSYMVQPKKYPDWSFELAFLNNENTSVEFSTSVDKIIDIILSLPGDERYFAQFQYLNNYRDDWFGGGASWKINPNLFIGGSMFLSVKSLEYKFLLDIEAYPLDDSIVENDQLVPFYSANFQHSEFLKFSNYRFLWKFGMIYKKEKFSLGLSITTPSVNIYSDSKKVSNKEKQANIKAPGSDEFLPDYVIPDYQEKKDVEANFKSPLSIAAGCTYYFPDKLKTLYTTVEFFSGIDPYRIVQAEENPYLSSGYVYDNLPFNEWLTFVHGANPVLNAALGYSWSIRENLILMAGYRTDFNCRKDLDYEPYIDAKKIKNLDLDLHHLTSGLVFTIKGQDLITGLQYTVGRNREQAQFANLSDPVEYNTEIMAPLQGTPQNTMNTFYNSISLYFGATFNFGGGN